MKFNGDIIITDPCYICKEREKVGEYPNGEDFFSYDEMKDYPDYRKMNEDELKAFVKKSGFSEEILPVFPDKWKYKSDQYEEENKKYKAAICEYRKNNISDWELCNYGEDMEAIGIKNYICRDTLYGDWSCTTYNSNTKEILGQFCADAGMVGVFLLEEVLKYNPEFDYHIERPWTTTLINDFDGEIDFEIIHTEGVCEDDSKFHNKGDKWEDDQVSVVGKGNINFETHQTGW